MIATEIPASHHDVWSAYLLTLLLGKGFQTFQVAGEEEERENQPGVQTFKRSKAMRSITISKGLIPIRANNIPKWVKTKITI